LRRSDDVCPAGEGLPTKASRRRSMTKARPKKVSRRRPGRRRSTTKTGEGLLAKAP
jgi:hypothetical protein